MTNISDDFYDRMSQELKKFPDWEIGKYRCATPKFHIYNSQTAIKYDITFVRNSQKLCVNESDYLYPTPKKYFDYQTMEDVVAILLNYIMEE